MTLKHIKVHYKFENKEIIKVHYEATLEYLKATAEMNCEMYKKHGFNCWGVLIEYEIDGFYDMQWIV